MTTMTKKRCSQCGRGYTYQGSGPGCNRAENNEWWCPSCTRVVNAALANVPRRFEVRYRNVREMPQYADLTLDQVLAWETQNEVDQQARGGLPIRRVFSPLFDLTTGDSQNVREVVGREMFSGVRFKVATWHHRDDWSIEVPMEWDTIEKRFTGEPWL